MSVNQGKVGRGHWLAWFLASIMGYGMGAILGISIAWRFFPTGTAMNGITLGLFMGATGGYFPWVVLHERITGAGLWAVACALGLGLADIIENYAMALLLFGSVIAVVSGIPQWLILRRKASRAEWWYISSPSLRRMVCDGAFFPGMMLRTGASNQQAISYTVQVQSLMGQEKRTVCQL